MSIEKETAIVKALNEKFGIAEDQLKITRERRIFGEVPYGSFMDIMAFVQAELGFDFLCTITGLDSGESLEFIYHLSNRDGIMLNLKLFTPKADPVIPSVVSLYNGSIFYERELIDMLGVRVEGLAPGRRYPLPLEWPEGVYPLRKDWMPEPLPEEPAVIAEVSAESETKTEGDK
jgi:Ni,Fe-hydrogenase III component G